MTPLDHLRTTRPATFFLSAALLAGCGGAPEPEGGSLTAISWGGSYARAVDNALYQPFEAETGVAIGREDYNGGLAQIRTQVETGNVYWDLVSMQVYDALHGCEEGLLEVLPPDLAGPGLDGTPAAEDFPEGTITECGVALIFYSTLYAYHPGRFSGEAPATIADFFDLERFPGRRGMRRTPEVNFEFALMADGVPTEQVYEVLDTDEGIERVFRKLDTIRDEVVWWEAGAQPPQMLADAEVVMTTAYNGRIFNAQALENQPFVIVWDGQVLDFSQLAIPAGAPNLDVALDYLRFATTPEAMARISRHIAYGPVRHSAAPLVGTHAETGIDMRPHLPTTPENMTNTLVSDGAWWSENLEEMNQRFSAWLAR